MYSRTNSLQELHNLINSKCNGKLLHTFALQPNLDLVKVRIGYNVVKVKFCYIKNLQIRAYLMWQNHSFLSKQPDFTIIEQELWTLIGTRKVIKTNKYPIQSSPDLRDSRFKRKPGLRDYLL